PPTLFRSPLPADAPRHRAPDQGGRRGRRAPPRAGQPVRRDGRRPALHLGLARPRRRRAVDAPERDPGRQAHHPLVEERRDGRARGRRAEDRLGQRGRRDGALGHARSLPRAPASRRRWRGGDPGRARSLRPAFAGRPRPVPLDFGRRYLRDLGPDDPAAGPPPLLIHGLPVYGYAFRAVVPELAAGRRLLIPDLPGAGDSDRPPPVHCAGYSPSWLARVLIGLLDRLGLASVDVLGHSWGGAIAVCLADAAPERVRRLVLVDATCFAQPLPLEGRLALVPGVGPYVFKNLYRRAALA